MRFPNLHVRTSELKTKSCKEYHVSKDVNYLNQLVDKELKKSLNFEDIMDHIGCTTYQCRICGSTRSSKYTAHGHATTHFDEIKRLAESRRSWKK